VYLQHEEEEYFYNSSQLWSANFNFKLNCKFLKRVEGAHSMKTMVLNREGPEVGNYL